MNQEEMKQEFNALYNQMANSGDINQMHTFGVVHKEMMEWMIQNKPDLAQQWIDKLESIRWKNYLTPKEAEVIVSKMEPKAPWSRDVWRQAMEQAGLELEKEPYYNRCALWVTMNMIMSDSSQTLAKYVDNGNLLTLVYELAVDKLTDKDHMFNIRKYFGV